MGAHARGQFVERGADRRFARRPAGKLLEARVTDAHAVLGIKESHAFFKPLDYRLQGLLHAGWLAGGLLECRRGKRYHGRPRDCRQASAQLYADAVRQLSWQLVWSGVPLLAAGFRGAPPGVNGSAVSGAEKMKEWRTDDGAKAVRLFVRSDGDAAQNFSGGGAQIRDLAVLIENEEHLPARRHLRAKTPCRRGFAALALLTRDGQPRQHGAIFETLEASQGRLAAGKTGQQHAAKFAILQNGRSHDARDGRRNPRPLGRHAGGAAGVEGFLPGLGQGRAFRDAYPVGIAAFPQEFHAGFAGGCRLATSDGGRGGGDRGDNVRRMGQNADGDEGGSQAGIEGGGIGHDAVGQSGEHGIWAALGV